MRAGLVVTSIRVPTCLEGYLKNFQAYNRVDDVVVFMIPDEKTPREAYELCGKLDHYMCTSCPTLEGQDAFVRKLGLDPAMFPRNSDNRRNIGYLSALAAGCDFMISIDDDNFCIQGDDYFASHWLVAPKWHNSPALSAKGGWLNPCDWLDTDRNVYQRGFPYFARNWNPPRMTEVNGPFEVHVNAGLWLGEPDLDGISWLAGPVEATEFSKSFLVAPDTWAPVNSQNTAVRAAAIPAYYFVPLEYPVTGSGWTGFGDIFQGYFLQACMKHLGGVMRVGTPIVNHRRNSHNYFSDAEKEWGPIRLLEEFLPWLTQECKLTGSDYAETYDDLSYKVEEWAAKKVEAKAISWMPYEHLRSMAVLMREWTKGCRTIGMERMVAK